MKQASNEKRVLAIDPNHRGFGYTVFEGPRLLVDWGVHDVHGAKNVGCVAAVGQLIELYRPDALILEDSTAKGSRRRYRVRQLIEQLGEFAGRHHVQVRRISRLRVRKTFAQLEATNKHQMACIIAEQFPELASRLPPERKPWMSEDARMAVFDSAALTFAFFSGANLLSAVRKKSLIVQ